MLVIASNAGPADRVLSGYRKCSRLEGRFRTLKRQVFELEHAD